MSGNSSLFQRAYVYGALLCRVKAGGNLSVCHTLSANPQRCVEEACG